MKRNVRDTSIESYHNLHNMGDAQQTVLVAVYAYPDCTDRELTQRLGLTDPNVVRPRRYELAELGLIRCSGKRVCTVTGKRACTWRGTR